MMRRIVIVAAAMAAGCAGAAALADGERGRDVYERQCSACHGITGEGDGPASVWLAPKPRNFSAGLFKVQSTPPGFLPTDDDLYETVTRGMPGSSMPAFSYLSEQERRDAVAYVKHLTATVDVSGVRVNWFDAAVEKGKVGRPVEVPEEPVDLVASVALGKELFKKVACFTCHGETGAGDGPLAPTLRDLWGNPTPPRDFNTQAFRGGHAGRDLYLRIHNGMPGTQMPAFGESVLKPVERWALVHYILSLRRKDVEVSDMLSGGDMVVRARRVESLPVEPADPAWESYDVSRVPLNPLWPEPVAAPAVAVTALHDGERIAVLCSWPDASFDGSAVRVQDFQDAMALQFSLKGTTPFIGMGDPANPVNIWLWRAGWQMEADGNRPEMHDAYPSMHVDAQLDDGPMYLTAAAAGNVIAGPHASPVEDANAEGFGTMRTQPPERQNVLGRGVWHDGFWNVVFVRELRSEDDEDVHFAQGKETPVAFAVWNGEQHDRDGRKVISNWLSIVPE